jgi:flagellar L-ring protein FlgH
MRINALMRTWVAGTIAIIFTGGAPALMAKSVKQDPQQTRNEYITRVQQQSSAVEPVRTTGSLWVPGGALTEVAADYKARRLDDVVMILVTEQTTAQSTGNVDSERSFQTSSAITGLPGRMKTGGVNPLFGAQSSNQLKGQGSATNTSKLLTSLSGRVIALLPNGNLVVEAERVVFMNDQHETMIVRGVLRPGDVSTNNTAPSTALSNLEVELKGKGVISDSTRRPNPAVRALLWLIGF